jgi:hypothetical protein
MPYKRTMPLKAKRTMPMRKLKSKIRKPLKKISGGRTFGSLSSGEAKLMSRAGKLAGRAKSGALSAAAYAKKHKLYKRSK